MFEVSTGEYILRLSSGALPDIYDSYVKSAKLSEEINLSGDGDICYFSLALPGQEWPALVVAQKYSPSGFGWNPGVLVVPETGVAFLGAGTRLLAYDFRVPARLWEDSASYGFFGWRRFENIVLMHAEVDLAAWTTSGQKLWTTFVDPPWDYRIQGGMITVEDCRGPRTFDLQNGPGAT